MSTPFLAASRGFLYCFAREDCFLSSTANASRQCHWLFDVFLICSIYSCLICSISFLLRIIYMLSVMYCFATMLGLFAPYSGVGCHPSSRAFSESFRVGCQSSSSLAQSLLAATLLRNVVELCTFFLLINCSSFFCIPWMPMPIIFPLCAQFRCTSVNTCVDLSDRHTKKFYSVVLMCTSWKRNTNMGHFSKFIFRSLKNDFILILALSFSMIPNVRSANQKNTRQIHSSIHYYCNCCHVMSE